MCFGSSQQSTTNTSSSGPSWLTGAAQSNLTSAQNLQSAGFQPFTGQMVAPASGQQQTSFGLANNLSNSVNGGPIGSEVSNVANAAPGSVTPSTISSAMSPYMNAYVGDALAPQIQNLNNQEALQSQLTQGAATSAGAFGDPRATMLQQNQNANNSLQEQGLVGNAYTSAFNTAIGAGAQDVSNNLNAQTTNANLANTQKQTDLAAANLQYGLSSGAANLENTYGGQQTAISQAGDTANYNQYLLAQQYPFLTSQNLNQTIQAATPGAGQTGTSTTSTPNNSGWGLLGTLAGVAAAPFTGGLSLAGSTALNLGNAGGTGGGLGGLYADGGRPPVGKPSIVGERGPELFVPDRPGTIIPHEVLQAARNKREAKHGKPKKNIKLGIAA
jgi:hypothetical protein